MSARHRWVGRTDGRARDASFNIRQAKFFPNGEKTRIFFPEGSVEEQIENAAIQLRRNLDYGRGLNTDPRVRAIKIDHLAVVQAAEWMREQLLGLVSVKRDAEQLVCQAGILSSS